MNNDDNKEENLKINSLNNEKKDDTVKEPDSNLMQKKQKTRQHSFKKKSAIKLGQGSWRPGRSPQL